MRLFYLVLIYAYVTSPVLAGDFQCNYSGNQQEMNVCALRDFKIADGSLNKEYKKRLATLDTQSQSVFREEQRTWLKPRDSHCRKVAKDSEGGSIWPIEFYGCLEELTTKRTKEIKTWSLKQ